MNKIIALRPGMYAKAAHMLRGGERVMRCNWSRASTRSVNQSRE
ncbi:MAG TPA: hypothetical protein VKB96_10730 [Gammaproteobacteria bacterium]|nr:hypothetical protein [Gammaproteobacteria bacterium]